MAFGIFLSFSQSSYQLLAKQLLMAFFLDLEFQHLSSLSSGTFFEIGYAVHSEQWAITSRKLDSLSSPLVTDVDNSAWSCHWLWILHIQISVNPRLGHMELLPPVTSSFAGTGVHIGSSGSWLVIIRRLYLRGRRGRMHYARG